MSLVRMLGNEKVFIGALGVLLLIPQAFNHLDGHARLRPTGARACSGDEPHYLLLLNSVLNDRDLDLANNYVSVHQGSLQAGEAFAGSALDHHVVYYVRGERRWWSDFYDVKHWKRDASGWPIPTPARELPDELKSSPERSYHLPGSTLLLAPVLYPFRGTRLLEPAAILLSAIATFFGMLAFRELIREQGFPPAVVNAATLLTCAGTPVLHYSRSFFNEPLLLALGVGAYALALSKDRYLWAAILIGLGMQMKPPFLLLAIPLAADLLWKRRLRALVMMGMPLLGSSLLLLTVNWVLFGSPWRPPVVFVAGDPIVGIRGLLLSTEHGLFLFAPMALIAAIGWPFAIRRRPRESCVIGFGFLLYFLAMATWLTWDGGHCYGPRYAVPVIPLFMVPFGLALAWAVRFWRLALTGIALVCAFSLYINLTAAVYYCRSFEWNPWDRIGRAFLTLAHHHFEWR
jgi:hypothetical protein